MSERAVILLVEDREDDIILIERAFLKAGIINPVQRVRDGEEAILYLRGDGKFSNRDEYPLPDLVLLDLALPGLDGFQVLEWVRQDPGLRALRIVVLTSSNDLKDVNRAYQLGANSFLVKPLDFADLVAMTEFLAHFLRLSQVPEISRARRQQPTKSPAY